MDKIRTLILSPLVSGLASRRLYVACMRCSAITFLWASASEERRNGWACAFGCKRVYLGASGGIWVQASVLAEDSIGVSDSISRVSERLFHGSQATNQLVFGPWPRLPLSHEKASPIHVGAAVRDNRKSRDQ